MAVALAGVALSSCAPAAGSGSGEPQDDLGVALASQQRREITLHVDNRNFYDAQLYAVASGSGHRRRLGWVPGYGEETFTFRWFSGSDLRIGIDLLAVGSYLTEPLAVMEGDELELVIQPDLHRRTPGPVP
jgi:hypothetical protein